MTIQKLQDDTTKLNEAINEGSKQALLNAISIVTDDVYIVFSDEAEAAEDMEARAYECEDVYSLLNFARSDLLDWLASF